MHASVLAYLAEREEVADGEDDDRQNGHHEEVDEDVGVQVVGRPPQIRHLRPPFRVCTCPHHQPARGKTSEGKKKVGITVPETGG